MRRLMTAVFALLAAVAVSVFSASPASAAAFVQHPDETSCSFEPGDIPGVDVFFPAACTIITLGSGQTIIVARGQLPAGYSLDSTFVGTLPCFGQTGRVTATVSGQVTAICNFRP